MSIRVVTVDAFTAAPFSGNPAAVCVLNEPAPEDWLRNVAREMNLSETAFLVPRDGEFDLRWFTPSVEVDLCGHATLASAHVLWEDKHLSNDQQARFHTRSGLLTADQRDGWIELDFPANPPAPIEPPAELLLALGLTSLVPVANSFDYLVEVESEERLRSLTPDMMLLRRIPARGIIVTARSSNPEFDFVSRFFAPAAGIDEDPVTGSAHAELGPYWGRKLDKTEMIGYQASDRGGVVRVRLNGDRVILGGQAVTVMEGTLHA